jgi:hypothetical protein
MNINIVRLDALELERRTAHVYPYEALLAQGIDRSSRGQVECIQVWVRGDFSGRASVNRLKLNWREQLELVGLWGVHDTHLEYVLPVSVEARVSVFEFERDGRYFIPTYVYMDGVEQLVRFTMEVKDGKIQELYHGVRIEQEQVA